MAWRFKPSKYKNSAPVVPKFQDLIRDLSIGSYRSHGNFIAASAAYMAFNWDVQGSNLAVLPLDCKGRKNKANVPLIFAHSDFVTDFQFSPFDDGLLATGSQDLTVKLWRIPESGMPQSGLNQPELVLASQPRRVETVSFHPTADCILASTSFDSLVIWDLIQAKELYNFTDHEDEVQSLGWQHSGKLLATQCKDRQLRILDPRQAKMAMSCESHQGIKDSKLVWINGGNDERIFTTGFNSDRSREIRIHDLRNLSSPQKNMELDMSAGILIPLYDPDTNMCFLAGKGDRNVQFIELADKEPFIIEGLKYSGEQTKGACLVPKRAMDVMTGEVNRVLQLCDSSVVPITWQVPRKSYREYHSDIYPETNGLDSACGPMTWWKGSDPKVQKLNLDPQKRPQSILTVFGGALSERDANKTPSKSENGHHKNGDSSTKSETSNQPPAPQPQSNTLFEEQIQKQNESTNMNHDVIENKENQIIRPKLEKKDSEPSIAPPSAVENKKVEKNNRPLSNNIFAAMDKMNNENDEQPKPLVRKPTVRKTFVRVSKFKHLKGDVILKGRFENLKNLSRTVPAECNFIKANEDRIAVPLTGPGGKLAVFETRKPGRIPDGVTPVLINGTTVLDFAFDPFDKARLVAGCDDGIIRVWAIPPGGLTCQVNTPQMEFSGHADKVQHVKWHPLAQDVLLTVAFDKTAKIWDLNKTEQGPLVELQGHGDQLFSAEWSGCGRYLASVCKDGKIRIFEPRKSSSPIFEGGEIVAKKGARVTWVLNDQYLIVTGFSKQSERQVMVYKVNPKLELVHTQVLDVSPAILIPHYDQDSSTLFLTSKGESTVTTFEVSLDPPHLFPLSPYRPSGLHQGFAFLPKNVLDVKNVEFARAYRLTSNTIEPISFTVPRVKTVYFQDDLFPMTKILWEPTLSANEWFQGSSKQAGLVSLCPAGMVALSGSNIKQTSKQQQDASNFSATSSNLIPQQIKGEMAKKAEAKLEESVSNMVDVSAKLEQDQMEGVDEKEWDDEEE